MNFFGNLFGTDHSGDQAAEGYLGQIPGTYEKYLNPYIQGGNIDYGLLQKQFQQMMQQPGQQLNQLGQGFQTDPGYQFQLKQALGAANQAAAAGGMAGSPAAQQHAEDIAQQMADRSYQNYLHNAMGIQGTGLQGLGGFEQQGFQASNALAENLARALMNQANLAETEQANRRSEAGGFLGGIGSVASDVLPYMAFAGGL